jgi:ubiquinone/menaquinone biosynthesis C-methylase UbiE
MSTTSDGRFWDRVARKYAADPIKDMAGYERTLKRTIELLRQTDTVIEFGCGTGTTALRLAPHVSRIIATDLSSEMIAIAREKAAAQNCTNIEFAAGTAGRSPRPGDSYDAVLAFNLLHLVADRPVLLAQALGVLKPGGLLITKTPCLKEMSLIIRLAVPLLRLIGKAPRVDYFSAAELRSDFEAAGFSLIEEARHGSLGKDPRIFLVARKQAAS